MMFSTSLRFKIEVNWMSVRKLFILVPSCGCVSGDKFHVLEQYPFPEYQFAHSWSSSLPTTALSEVFLCSLHEVLRFRKVFVQGGSRPMWLNKNSPSCCNWQLFFAFVLEEQRSGMYIYFLGWCGFSVPFQSCFCLLASWVVSGWGAQFAFLIRLARAPCGNLLELERGS